MNLYDVYNMKRGRVLVAVNGFFGDDDFYKMHEIIKTVLKPDDLGYSVDSMCIGGYFNKNGITVRTSSESPYDTLSFFFDSSAMSEEEQTMVMSWIDVVVNVLNNK